MKVELARIKDIPLVLEESINVADWDVERFDINFEGPITVKAECFRAGKEILINVETDFFEIIVCSRCAKEVKKEKNQKFMLNYNETEYPDFIDIDNDIREQLLLDMPLKVLCKQDCKGICPHCGKDLNEGECS
ncbi:MAG: DUF177 domain-containing protein, partial [Candidatus Omnitrophica bacterium]|nr:DUF177 domain-containing protein [Candidatus Omnitrophota bacterium]